MEAVWKPVLSDVGGKVKNNVYTIFHMRAAE